MSGVLSVLAGAKSAVTGPTATLTAAQYSRTGFSPITMTFTSAGVLNVDDDANPGDQYSWLTSGNASDCKLVYSVTSGSFTSSPASGVTMSSNLVFTRADPSGGVAQTVIASFQIQKVSDSSVLAGPVSIELTCDNI